MAPTSAARIKYTTKYSALQIPRAALPEEPYQYGPPNDPSAHPQAIDKDDPPPVIELVTVLSAKNTETVASVAEELSYAASDVQDGSVKGRYLIVQSEELARTIKDVVQYYPDQILTGSTIVIHQPFACLMHHMDDFERLTQSETQSIAKDELELLLEFLRPLSKTNYLPAKNRLSSSEPTVRFQDIWILMKPGSLAYVHMHGEWLGCVVEKSKKTFPSPLRKSPQVWLIDWWHLQPDLPLDRLGFISGTTTLERFDGERLVTDLPIIPAEFFDAHDSGERRRRFENRGSKICDILYGGSRHMRHDGETLDRSRHPFTGRVLVGGTAQVELYPTHDWSFDWSSPVEALRRRRGIPLTGRGDIFDPKTHSRDSLTMDQLVIISPCLGVFRIPENKWALINIENVQSLHLTEDCPPPFISDRNLASILSLVSSVNSTDAMEDSNSKRGLTILLTGSSGVGKTYTFDYMARKTGRPLVSFAQKDMPVPVDSLKTHFSTWSNLLQRWNAICVIDHIDFSNPAGWSPIVFCKALPSFRGILFLTSNPHNFSGLIASTSSHIELKLHLPSLDGQKRQDTWAALGNRLQASNTGVHLTRAAKEFLRSSAPRVTWNGHELKQCFRLAIDLARAEAVSAGVGREDGAVVEVAHFKEAMNSTHDFRRQVMEIGPAGLPPPPPAMRPLAPPKSSRKGWDDSDSSSSSSEDDEPPKPASLTLASDSSLCIPSLNCIEWESFQAAGKSRELFRNSKFHAIDLLEGEPQIVFQTDSKTRSRMKFLSRKTASVTSDQQSANSQQKRQKIAVPDGETALPERIRVNSPAIIKAFSEIHEDQFSGSFLMFKPFLSLLYYEQDFRDWVAHQEKTIRDRSSSTVEVEPPNIDDEAEKSVDVAALQEMRCLLSFIDNHIKKKEQYLTESLCKTVAFSDLPLLFNPGDSVLETNEKQAYRVIGVTHTRHRVKKPNEDKSDFWKDFSKAEFADNPVFIHCVHVDFDGVSVGPVQSQFRISRFEGRKDVLSLPVYPFRYARDDGLRAKLIERGGTFLELAAIKHMHYAGSTIGTREELDSQVVIDFDEAISRHPEWKPELRSTTSGFPGDAGDDTDSESEDDEPPRHPSKRKTAKPNLTKCVKECCRTETAHDEEYVGERRGQEYVASHMGSSVLTSVSVTMIIRPLKDFNEQNALTDDDLLVVSYCVFGFALRSRKWYKLDMTYLSEVNALGEGEGFDQLVLPAGHGDLVKSMIRQHFRNKKISAGKVDSSDIVRGKGRGLIMLLHGVPGVGKTSTAECIADLFRRPLFQITSGDLGLSAKEVEDTLNDNFNLASRWDSVLLIDEADVFLGERTKEDFVRNSLVAVFLRMMEYYSGVLFLTTNRVGVFDEAFTSRIHISLYYPPLDRESTRKIFEKNGERIQARYKSNGRPIDIKVSEITEFALDYFDNNKEGRWNGRQIRNAFQSAVALAELDASGTDDLFSDVDHGQLVVLGKKSFDTVAHVYKSFLAYLKQVYGADYARRARENLWRFDAFGALRIPNALPTRLAVADPVPPPRGPEPPRPGQYQQPRYDYREPSHPYPYPERYGYDYPGQRPRGGPPPEQQHQHYRETPRGMGPQPSGYHAPSTRPEDPRSEGYHDARGFSQPGPHSEWAGRGGGEAGSGAYQAPSPHDPQHYPSGHLSPFQGQDR